ncbi:hypothetical protein [Granulicella sp. dw_53]|uniref:hypothetical protein n=1 Tax=Granulicella sp. dw_53 TaxID=2719792 RepID=UPI001BD4E5D4|nr:hypothetical protein [Granulicella sp. dw_53]
MLKTIASLLLFAQMIGPGRTGSTASSGGPAVCGPLGYTTNLALRLEATNIASCAGAFSGWPDSSGLSNTANMVGGPICTSTGGSNGGAFVTLNGTQYGNLATGIAPAPSDVGYTIFAVASPSSAAKGKLTGSSVNAGAFSYFIGDGTHIEQGADIGQTVALGMGTTSMTANSWHQINVAFTGTNAIFRIDSTTDGTTTFSSTFAQQTINLLFAEHSLQEIYNGKVEAILIYRENMTLTNKQTVESYMRCKYSVN